MCALITTLAACRPVATTATAPPSPLPDGAFRVQWGSPDMPKTVTPGERVSVAVIVKNVGDALWPDRAMGHPSANGWGAVRLSYRWWRAGDPPALVADYAAPDRTELPAPLGPGASTILTIAVTAPPDAGPYLLQLELVQEMVSWFEAKGAATLKVPVEVAPVSSAVRNGREIGSVSTGASIPGLMPSPPPVPRPRIMLPPEPPDQAGLRALLAALVFLAAVPLAVGYLVTVQAKTPPGPERLALIYAIGFAALVFGVSAAATFLPARIHGPALAVTSIVLVAAIRAVRARLMEDIRASLTVVLLLLAVAAVAMALLNFPSMTTGDTVFFDGHGNHDGFFNVGNASWLLDHNCRDVPAWSVAAPLYSPVGALIGPHSHVTRLGAESLLAAAAATTGHDPLALYLPVLSALLLPWLATAFLVARRGWPTRRFPLALVLAIGSIQPLFLFAFANGNFPNLVGLFPCTLLLLLFRWHQKEARPPFGLLPISLATAAPLGTYPEVLAVTAAGLGVLVLASLGRLPLIRTARAALAVTVGVALNPLVAHRAWGGLRTAMGADPSIAGGQAWFADLQPAQWLPAAVTLSFDAAHRLPTTLALVVSISLVIAILAGLRRMDDPALGFAALLPLAAVCVLGWHRAMPYAYQKGIQWTAVVLCVVLAAGIMECLRAPWTRARGRWWRAAAGQAVAAASVISVLWLLVATAAGFRRMIALAEVKRIDSAFRAVSAMARRTPAGAAIAVRDLPLGKDGFFAMWIPYFIRDHPLFFEWGESPSNYLASVVRHSVRIPLTPPPYVLVPAGSRPEPGETPVVGNGRFWLFSVRGDAPPPALGPVPRVPLTVDGVAAVARVDGQRPGPDGSFRVSAGSKAVWVQGGALLLDAGGCPGEVYLGLVDLDGTMVVVAPAERVMWPGWVSTFELPPEAACGLRARVETERLRPGAYGFRAFQLVPGRGFYTGAIGDPHLVVTP